MYHREVSIGDGKRGLQRENKNTVAKHLIKVLATEVVKYDVELARVMVPGNDDVTNLDLKNL